MAGWGVGGVGWGAKVGCKARKGKMLIGHEEGGSGAAAAMTVACIVLMSL